MCFGVSELCAMGASKWSQPWVSGSSWRRKNLIRDDNSRTWTQGEMTETTLSGWGMRQIDTDPAEHALGMWKSPADGNDTTAVPEKQHMVPICK